MLSTHKIKNAIRKMKHWYYEWGDKAGKLLAWQIKKEEASRALYTIKKNERFTSNPSKIKEAFPSYYQSLYTSQGCDPVSIKHFLDKLEIPSIIR